MKVISEVLGSPQEHVDKTLYLLLNKIKERKELQVSNEHVFKAEKMEDKPLFTGFLEYELKIETIDTLVDFCFDFMPSSIEILEPDELELKAMSVSDLFNELLAKLHNNDMLLRSALVELSLLKKNMNEQ